jgi:hypothetical protein
MLIPRLIHSSRMYCPWNEDGYCIQPERSSMNLAGGLVHFSYRGRLNNINFHSLGTASHLTWRWVRARSTDYRPFRKRDRLVNLCLHLLTGLHWPWLASCLVASPPQWLALLERCCFWSRRPPPSRPAAAPPLCAYSLSPSAALSAHYRLSP